MPSRMPIHRPAHQSTPDRLQLKLDVLRIPLRPSESELAPLLGPRDTLPEGRVTHRLILTYKLSLAEGGKVTPTLPMLNKSVREREGLWGCCLRGVVREELFISHDGGGPPCREAASATASQPPGSAAGESRCMLADLPPFTALALRSSHPPALLRRYVYDGELEAQMYMVFDANKQKLAGEGGAAFEFNGCPQILNCPGHLTVSMAQGHAQCTGAHGQPIHSHALTPHNLPARTLGATPSPTACAPCAIPNCSGRYLPRGGAVEEGGLHYPRAAAP